MTTEQILSFTVIAGMMAVFIWDRFRYDIVACCALVVAVALGVVKPGAKAAAPVATGGVVDPVQWWGALSQQFQQIASNAICASMLPISAPGGRLPRPTVLP